ncbi:hypothetical protein MKX03_000504 [Papaver bracteatum]|nr:hypothetical protein MKX03_000504 [Papaver bracteatum]
MAELTEQKKTVSDYIEKAKNVAKNTAKNIADNFEKVTALTKKPETDLETKEEDNANSVTIAAKVSVNNPYNIDISIAKATYDFFYGDGGKVNGTLPDQGKLKAKTKTMLDVRVKVPHSNLTSPGNDHHVDIDYKLEMILFIDIPVIGHVNIPVSGKGKFPRPRMTTTMSDFLSDQGGLTNEILGEIKEEEVEKQEATKKNVVFKP